MIIWGDQWQELNSLHDTHVKLNLYIDFKDNCNNNLVGTFSEKSMISDLKILKICRHRWQVCPCFKNSLSGIDYLSNLSIQTGSFTVKWNQNKKWVAIWIQLDFEWYILKSRRILSGYCSQCWGTVWYYMIILENIKFLCKINWFAVHCVI